ncbi:hypothetical protein HGRIS_006683 [Hohenbuehelia grisea]|uniref:Uncharacterized protein n=1 Tax=Hohenbuehelia grisea TaxID=104357 RepID=A0ABR3J9S6_9AGAR
MSISLERNTNTSDLKRCCRLCPVLRNKRGIQAHRKGCQIYEKLEEGLVGKITYDTETLGVCSPTDDDSDYDSDTAMDSDAPELSPTIGNPGPLQITSLLELLADAERQLRTQSKKHRDKARTARRIGIELEIAQKAVTGHKTRLDREIEQNKVLSQENLKLSEGLSSFRITIGRLTDIIGKHDGGQGVIQDATSRFWLSKARRIQSQEEALSTFPRNEHCKNLSDVLARRETLLTNEIAQLRQRLTEKEAELKNHQMTQADSASELTRIISARDEMVTVIDLLGTKLVKSQGKQIEAVSELENLTNERNILKAETSKLTNELKNTHQELSEKVIMVECLTSEKDRLGEVNDGLQSTIHDEQEKSHSLANKLQVLRPQFESESPVILQDGVFFYKSYHCLDLASSQRKELMDIRQAALLNWLEAQDLVKNLAEDSRVEVSPEGQGDNGDFCPEARLRGLQNYVAEMVDNHSRAVIEDRKRERAGRASDVLDDDGDRRKRRRLVTS